jgi:hypothetical protein
MGFRSAHTHTRRMELYFYFDVPQGQRVFHMMGEPTETRHLIMKDHEAVIAAHGVYISIAAPLIILLSGEWLVRINSSPIWIRR